MYRSQWHWMGQKLTKSHHLQMNVQIQMNNCSSPTMWVTNGPVPPNLAAVTFSVLFGHGWKNSCRWHCLFFIFKVTAYSVWASCLRVTGWVASELMLRSGVKVAKGKTLIVVQFPAHFSWTCQLWRVQPTSRWVAAWVFSRVSVLIYLPVVKFVGIIEIYIKELALSFKLCPGISAHHYYPHWHCMWTGHSPDHLDKQEVVSAWRNCWQHRDSRPEVCELVFGSRVLRPSDCTSPLGCDTWHQGMWAHSRILTYLAPQVLK